MNKAIAGTYTIAGTIELPTGVKNPSNVTATTLVIVGNLNRALNKATTASGSTGDSEGPSKAVDELPNTKWCSTNSGDKWLTVDLGKSYQIGKWYVRHAEDIEGDSNYTTKDFKLQKSDNGQDWVDVDSVTGNTLNVTDRNVTLFRARYVRLYYITQADQSVNYAARVFEFAVYKDAL